MARPREVYDIEQRWAQPRRVSRFGNQVKELLAQAVTDIATLIDIVDRYEGRRQLEECPSFCPRCGMRCGIFEGHIDQRKHQCGKEHLWEGFTQKPDPSEPHPDWCMDIRAHHKWTDCYR